jgi:plastocyanin
VTGDRVQIFKSQAHYFGNRPPISWDVAMVGTRPDWRVEVKAGDKLELSTTYETKIASWYESMGINVVYMADAEVGGADPYKERVDYPGVLNHGHFAENNDHGGKPTSVWPNPATLPGGLLSSGPISIGGYTYSAGDFRLPGSLGRPALVERGDQLTFQLAAGDQATETWHSVTSCKSPCNRSTGISYPIADGEIQFDSGQLGVGGAPTVNRTTWSTPPDLPLGTYTFFCRIHPLMRGALRVVKPE